MCHKNKYLYATDTQIWLTGLIKVVENVIAIFPTLEIPGDAASYEHLYTN